MVLSTNGIPSWRWQHFPCISEECKGAILYTMALRLSDLHVTQGALRHDTAAMQAHVEAGGSWRLARPLIKVARFEDGALYLHDGHHRCVATWRAGRHTLLEDEFVVEDWTYADWTAVNVAGKWVTPFDPRIEVRATDLTRFRQRLASVASVLGGEETAIVALIAAHREEFAAPRTATTPRTVPDLALTSASLTVQELLSNLWSQERVLDYLSTGDVCSLQRVSRGIHKEVGRSAYWQQRTQRETVVVFCHREDTHQGDAALKLRLQGATCVGYLNCHKYFLPSALGPHTLGPQLRRIYLRTDVSRVRCGLLRFPHAETVVGERDWWDWKHYVGGIDRFSSRPTDDLLFRRCECPGTVEAHECTCTMATTTPFEITSGGATTAMASVAPYAAFGEAVTHGHFVYHRPAATFGDAEAVSVPITVVKSLAVRVPLWCIWILQGCTFVCLSDFFAGSPFWRVALDKIRWSDTGTLLLA